MPAKIVARRNGAAQQQPKVFAASRSLMKDRAYAEIKNFILHGPPVNGSFLAERTLASQLGMSKTPVKAALHRLESEGFISISPQQGILVREMTVHEIADNYEIRAALETHAMRHLAGRLNEEQIARLEENLAEQRSLLDHVDVSRAVQLDSQFHGLFCEFLGNQEILRVMAVVREKMQRVVAKVFQLHAARMRASYDEHAAVARALIAGDGAKAAKQLEQHLEYGKQILLSPRGH